MSDSEKTAAAADIRELIEFSGQDATLFRAAPDERLYGSDDEAFAEVCTFKLEFVPTPQEDISDNVDATASVLPDLDIRTKDMVHVGSEKYRVQTVVSESLFGVVTHKTLELVRLHGS